MKTLLSVTLIVGISVAVHSQIYFRGNLCADFAVAEPASYHFSDHPDQMTATNDFKAQFGGGAFAQMELGLRFKKLEVGVMYAMHGGSSHVQIDSVFSNRGDTILTSRSVWFTSLNRGGMAVTYFFSEKKFSPLVFAGIHGLIRPRFTISYKSDTLEHPNVPTRRYSQTFEYYGAGIGLGVSSGIGISFSADERLRCVIKAGYNFQKWTPTQFLFSQYKSNNSTIINYDDLPSQTVNLSSIFISFGGTYYFGIKEEDAPQNPL